MRRYSQHSCRCITWSAVYIRVIVCSGTFEVLVRKLGMPRQSANCKHLTCKQGAQAPIAELYRPRNDPQPRNDPGPEMIPSPEMIPKLDPKWSRGKFRNGKASIGSWIYLWRAVVRFSKCRLTTTFINVLKSLHFSMRYPFNQICCWVQFQHRKNQWLGTELTTMTGI